MESEGEGRAGEVERAQDVGQQVQGEGREDLRCSRACRLNLNMRTQK